MKNVKKGSRKVESKKGLKKPDIGSVIFVVKYKKDVKISTVGSKNRIKIDNENY